MTILIQNHVINGELVHPQSNAYLDVFSPPTGEVIAKTTAGNSADIDALLRRLKLHFPVGAQRWYASDEYTAIKGLRINATKAGWLIFSDGFKLP